MSKTKTIEKHPVIEKHRLHDKDTGSCEVQIALISARVTHLTEHLKEHRKDYHSRRGLIALTNKRRRLLDYLKRTDLKRYSEIIKELKLRR